jgi:hypothetical protein
MNIQNVIPVSVDLGLVSNPKPNVVVFNPPATATGTATATATATATTRNPLVGVLQPKTTFNSTATATDNSTATATSIASNGDVNVNNKISLSILVVFIMMFSL